ncbi:MAG: UDP-N-acetylmuramoyl-L-alanyl-D-glutamate--2,6-diaminopimelate ligase [Gammaproteobacteria bacterium]|nr:UDP-N-acetylmuramoyl-L-alanyl-D-glutamate--2,6-diaminopimelate ligase [Gammaproteobacteria bacterium]
MKTVMGLLKKLNAKISDLTPQSLTTLAETVPTAICLDSRSVTPGSLFITLRTGEDKSHLYAQEALKRGCFWVLSDHELDASIPHCVVPHLKNRLVEIAEYFYGKPPADLSLIGVTGTNGKTSTSQFIAQALCMLNQPCGVIGTLGYGFLPDLTSTGYTTPDIFTLRACLHTLHEASAQYVSMEVSSHALDQDRTLGLPFEMAVFTNLTRDHLDYHDTFERYRDAKAKLFACPTVKYAVLNADDPHHQFFAQALPNEASIIRFGLHHPGADIRLSSATPEATGMTVHMQVGQKTIQTHLPLFGLFNVENVMAMIGALVHLKVPVDTLAQLLPQLKPVKGRMEVIHRPGKASVVIDYAHTPDALEKVLLSLRAHCTHKLISVFGCGGNRDRGKRPLMAAISERLADFTFLTQDNHRFEDPAQIFADLESGFKNKNAFARVNLRAEAIQAALEKAGPNDIILLAGKGHETYLDIEGVHHPFDERLIIQHFDHAIA